MPVMRAVLAMILTVLGGLERNGTPAGRSGRRQPGACETVRVGRGEATRPVGYTRAGAPESSVGSGCGEAEEVKPRNTRKTRKKTEEGGGAFCPLLLPSSVSSVYSVVLPLLPASVQPVGALGVVLVADL